MIWDVNGVSLIMFIIVLLTAYQSVFKLSISLWLQKRHICLLMCPRGICLIFMMYNNAQGMAKLRICAETIKAKWFLQVLEEVVLQTRWHILSSMWDCGKVHL